MCEKCRAIDKLMDLSDETDMLRNRWRRMEGKFKRSLVLRLGVGHEDLVVLKQRVELAYSEHLTKELELSQEADKAKELLGDLMDTSEEGLGIDADRVKHLH